MEMKRLRDDVYAGPSQCKLPLGSSRGDSHGQSQIPATGEGGGGGGNGLGGTSREPTTNDALTHFKEVKDTFQDQREKYDMYLEIFRDFGAQRTNTDGVIARVKELFEGHNKLILGFKSFLPEGCEIILDSEEAPPPNKKSGYQEALNFVRKIKNNDHVFKAFLDILKMDKEHKDINQVYNEVVVLFDNHPNLLDEFKKYIPNTKHNASLVQNSFKLDNDEAPPPNKKFGYQEAISFARKIRERFQNNEHVYKAFIDILKMDKEHKDINQVYSEVAVLFDNHPDLLDEFKKYIPNTKHNASLVQNSFKLDNDEAPPPNKKFGYQEAISFARKIRERFHNNEYVYKAFIDILKIDKEHKDINQVYSEVAALFDNHLDLLDEFRKYISNTKHNASLVQNSFKLDSDEAPPPNKKSDYQEAISFVRKIRERFQNNEHVYKAFIDILKMNKEHKDINQVYSKVATLFNNHPDLLDEFKKYIPNTKHNASHVQNSFKRDSDQAPPPNKKFGYQEAISFARKIRERFQNNEHVYKAFIDILKMDKEHNDINQVYSEVATLFDNHPDLLDEFKRFIPNAKYNASPVQNSSQLFIERGFATPMLWQMHVDKPCIRQDRMDASHIGRGLSVDHPELDDDKAMVKMHKEQMKCAEKNGRDKRKCDQDDREPDHDNTRDSNLQMFPDKKQTGRKVEGFGTCNQGSFFFDKVKKKLGASDAYHLFLKCLHIYSNGLIKRNDLQNLVTDLLEKYPDLTDGFNDFMEQSENIDRKCFGLL